MEGLGIIWDNEGFADLVLAKAVVYDKLGYALSDFAVAEEGKEYAACTFSLLKIESFVQDCGARPDIWRSILFNVENFVPQKIVYRNAKITPTKNGQFVTLWKRDGRGQTAPLDVSDDVDFVIINVRKGADFGQFVFPKAVLNEKDIIAGNGKSGKRGFRVYPPWDVTESRQAGKTQEWQVAWFWNSRF